MASSVGRSSATGACGVCRTGRLRAWVATTAISLGIASIVLAQSPTYGVGRPPTPEEIRAWDIAISPDGKELPEGRGTAADGKPIYERRCLSCHGPTGKEGPNDQLAGGTGTLASAKPIKTVGSYWSYATTVWDYVNRAMPYDLPGTLTVDEVYALTAYILHLNGIVGERDVIDRATLPKVRLPNRDGFVPDERPDVGKGGQRAAGGARKAAGGHAPPRAHPTIRQ